MATPIGSHHRIVRGLRGAGVCRPTAVNHTGVMSSVVLIRLTVVPTGSVA